MIKRLIEMYESGSISGYQVMMDRIYMVDPANPALVLSELPEEILDEMLAYARRYDPRRPHFATFIPPAEDQVMTAKRWICDHRDRRPKPVNQ
jgi:hypothetical protein